MPTRWSPSEGLSWKIDLVGYGQSTPVVFDDQIYVTSISGPQKEQVHVQAFDADGGKELWQYEAGDAFIGSPAVVEGRLLIGTDSGTLYCFGEK